MKSSFKKLQHKPVIAAVRDMAAVERAINSHSKVIFLMGGCISGVQEITRQAQEAGKHIFLHVELIKGLGRDKEAIEYIASEVRPEGVVSTKPQLIQVAAKLNLTTVLQIFMIDSQAFESGLRNIISTKPSAIEIMPGLMPRVAAQIKSHVDIPLITAGLIKQPHEVEMMLAAGCDGVAVSEESIWDYQPKR